ncbi:MAG: response regulator [Candidatus Eremiobacteraeota bacterium]|nr:response regulator [Candidatus Eremiobacteraeota bacterium]
MDDAGNNKELVLLVDDDEHILRSLEIYLKMEGFRVITANSGKKALEILHESRPDLIVLDIMMPEMDGFEVLGHIKNDPERKTIPVIMLTAKSQDIDVLKGYQEGIASYMTKPFNLNELVDNINLILESVTEGRK